jgi:hypothetical protein
MEEVLHTQIYQDEAVSSGWGITLTNIPSWDSQQWMRYYTHKYTKLSGSAVDEVLHSQIYQVETVSSGWGTTLTNIPSW